MAIEPKETVVPVDMSKHDNTDKEKTTDQEKTTDDKKHDQTEAASVEAGKTYYSKLSVWLMILFSGLAIGSDG